LGADSLKIGIF